MTEVLRPPRIEPVVLAPRDADEELTPIDRYLREQQQLTAVERFAKHHDADLLPAQERWYRGLIPLERPAPGQQYGFEVDLDACSGCKACVTACHRLNGLDDGEAFRSVGTLIGTVAPLGAGSEDLDLVALARGGSGTSAGVATAAAPWQQTVTTACHHCLDPACLTGCPVDAYEKDPVTGIVKHLDDQCIGCSYCTLTCPYEVPTFNEDRGIVRKCDLCSDRLADGEAPACVQACPTSAISIALVDVAALRAETAVDGAVLVPAAPASGLTQPTTRYRSKRPLPVDAVPADHFSVVPGHAHMPLTVMLVLTQMAVGAFVADLVLRHLAGPELAGAARPVTAAGALGVGLLALAASVLHLGRPLYAWRAFIGFGHSWLSREIVAFGAFAAAASLYGGSLWISPLWPTLSPVVTDVLGWATAVIGVIGVGCSVMIYVVTGRGGWRLRTTAPRFLATTAITGVPLTLLLATVAAAAGDEEAVVLGALRPLLLVVVVVTVLKLAAEASVFVHLGDAELTPLRRTAMLLDGDLWSRFLARFGAALVGGVALPLVLYAAWSQARPSVEAGIVVTLAMVTLTVVGELIERWLFFTAVSSPRMPGGFR